MTRTILSLLLCLASSSCVSSILEVSENKQTESLRKIPHAEKNYAKPAFSKIRKANERRKYQPQKAVALYLTAARELELYKEKNSWAKRAYQQALGKSIEIIQTYQLWGKTVTTGKHSFKISSHCQVSGNQLRDIDHLYYTGKFSSSTHSSPLKISGRGTTMTAYSKWSEERAKKYPFMPKIGYAYSVTALAHWGDGSSVNFQLLDSRECSQLSANFAIPHTLTQSASKSLLLQGLANVLRPEKGIGSMHISSFTPIDPSKIPVVFVHGLAASPNLWIKPAYELLKDDTIRDNYQFYVYFYPTGLPLAHSAAGLKKEIKRLHSHLKKNNGQSSADKMVVIGHSMGGLLTSAVTRDYRGAKSEIYTKNTHLLTTDHMSRNAIIELLENPPLSCITRAIFIATPHRGSSYADNLLGKITSRLINIPKSIVSLDPVHYREDLTELGKSIFNIQERRDGIQRLRYNNPILKYNLSRPKLKNVTYHSIIGDRGWRGKQENSSDGVVRYSSSHLANVRSELIVPAWHNVQDSKQAQHEMARILQLHLESP